MKLCKKITGGIARIAELICMVMIALLVVVIVTELLRRNFLNQSYRGTIEVCGIAFLWMAFIGLIPLYHNSGLMRLDFLVAHTKGGVYEPCKVFGGNLLYVSGCGCIIDNQPAAGKLGQDYTLEQGQEFARRSMLNVLSVVQAKLGSLDRVKNVVKILVFVA